MAGVSNQLRTSRNLIIIFLTPLVFLFVPVAWPSREANCAYGVIIMAVYWMTEVMPLAVTALLPIVIFPYLGVLDSKTICKNYLKDTNFLFVGGLIVAVAVEHWNLHKRIALRVLLLVGTTPRWLMFGFMITTAFLSMWISNTATTAMMLPIAQAVLTELEDGYKNAHRMKGHNGGDEPAKGKMQSSQKRLVETNEDEAQDDGNNSDIEVTISESISQDENNSPFKDLCKGLTLCICYSANIGGTATLTGTGPNLVAKGILDTLYKGKSGVTFSSWFVYSFPCMLICLVLAWCWLQLLFLGWRTLFGCCTKANSLDSSTEVAAKHVIRTEYNKLGSICFAEIAIIVHFAILVILWLTREVQFSNDNVGWGNLFKPGYVTDSSTVITIAVMLFICPSEPFWKNKRSAAVSVETKKPKPVPALLTWKAIHEKLPWNVVLLLGGGFALADACKLSGLSEWLGQEMAVFRNVPPWAMVLIICIIVSFFTEITSNTATATIFIPILAELAEGMDINPLYVVLPVTITTSFAFMLPVATPPNAIAFAYGHLKVTDMVKTGVVLNFLCILVVTIGNNTWGKEYLDLGTFPSWAQRGPVTEAIPTVCVPVVMNTTAANWINSTITTIAN